MERNRTLQALNDFNCAIELNSKLADSFEGRGLLYLQENQTKLALADLNKAISLNPYVPEPFVNRAKVALKLKHISKAKRNLTRAMQIYTQRDNFSAYQTTRRLLMTL